MRLADLFEDEEIQTTGNFRLRRFQHGLTTIDYNIIKEEDGDYPEYIGAIYIRLIYTKSWDQNKGYGRAALAAFLKRTDDAGKTVCLHPIADEGRIDDLNRFYRSFGFTPDYDPDDDSGIDQALWVRHAPV